MYLLIWETNSFSIFNIIIRKEDFTNLKDPLNSSILSKTLEEGLQIKTLIFYNYDNPIKDPVFHISFSANTLTIDWSRTDKDKHLKYLQFLFELWPGLILRLKGLNIWNEERLDMIQRLLNYCEGSPLCWKLFFSKVVIHIDIDEIRSIEYFKILNKLKHLYDSLSKIYEVEFENITYEDLFKDRVSQFKMFIERWRDEYNNQKLNFERALKNKGIGCYFIGCFYKINVFFNQTISELKLKEFEFYADKIAMDRYD